MWPANPTLSAGTQLRRATAQGDIHKVKQLLDEKLINDTSSNGNTALHWSIDKQHYAVTKLLLMTSGIDVDAKNNEGYTPLHLAAKQGDKKTVYRLLKAGAGQKNPTDNKGFYPLDYAFGRSDSFIVTLLKKMLPDIIFKDEDRLAEQAYEKFKINNPNLLRNRQIFDPNYFFDKKVARYFLPGNRFKLIEIQTATKKGLLNPHKLFCSGNLLQSAALSRIDTFEKFRWLLEQGVDPNLQGSHEVNPSSYKNTALHTLIANEDEKDALEFIDLLITHANPKFNFNLTDSEGKTCLCLAVKVGLLNVARKLITLENSVDVNISDEEGNTPLHYALLLGRSSIASELLENLANKNVKNKENKNPYELLISTDIEDVRDCLETIWINPDRKVEKSKKTYIQHCMENRQHAKNEWLAIFTDTPLSIEQKRKNIIFLIAAATGDLPTLKENCDSVILNRANAKGNTALHLACQHSHVAIVEFLLQQPNIDLHKENNEKVKAADLLNNLFLANLFEEKLLDTKKTEKGKDTFSRLNQRKEVLSNETMSALRNY